MPLTLDKDVELQQQEP